MPMDIAWIRVRLRLGTYQNLTSVEQLGGCLVEHWPARFSGSVRHVEAQAAVMDALAGTGTSAKVRDAFRMAVGEAGIRGGDAKRPA
jgi:NAD(P)H-hydrate repair Nnr-like enzyme with NAD(P)H-hydrate epimerase domain